MGEDVGVVLVDGVGHGDEGACFEGMGGFGGVEVEIFLDVPDGGWFVGETEGFEVAGFEDGARTEDGLGVDVELGVFGGVGRWSRLVDSCIGVRFLPYFCYESWYGPDVSQDPEN